MSGANSPLVSEHQWSVPDTVPIRGVVLVTHGLNNKPSVMDKFATYLVGDGYAVLRLALTGHRGEGNPKELTTAENWRGDLLRAFRAITTRFPDQPIYTVGYSLGALVTIVVVDENPAMKFSRMVFLAPAVSLSTKTRFIELLTPFRFVGSSLPSLTPPQYRSRGTTPLAAYNAMFSLEGDAEKLTRKQELNEIPTKIFLSSGDELVSVKRLKRWLSKNELVTWTVHELAPSGTSYNHLIVDEDSLGHAEWERLTSEISAFFREAS